MSDAPETPPEDEEPEDEKPEVPTTEKPHFTLEVQSLRVTTSTTIVPDEE